MRDRNEGGQPNKRGNNYEVISKKNKTQLDNNAFSGDEEKSNYTDQTSDNLSTTSYDDTDQYIRTSIQYKYDDDVNEDHTNKPVENPSLSPIQGSHYPLNP